MLFGLCVVVWCYGWAKTPVELILAFVAIMVRAGYLRRRITLVTRAGLFVAVLAAVAPLAVPVYQILRGAAPPLSLGVVSSALMFAGRILVTVMVIVNLTDDPTVKQVWHFLMRLSAGMSVLAQLVVRYPFEIRLRTRDILYAGKLRFRGGVLSLRGKLSLIGAIAVALSIEFAGMANQVAVVVAARGKMPRSSAWKTPPLGARAVLIADAIYLIVFSVLWTDAPWPR